MKVSVVISAYNGKQYIEEQLESIRTQTRSVDEVLIADDCSTDGTPQLVQAFIDRHQLTGWHVEVNQENKGWRRNFMEALWASEGDLVFSCDQDDRWDPKKVELMVGAMTAHPEISILASNYDEFYPDGKHQVGPWPKKKALFEVPLTNNYMLVKAPGCTYCVRRSLLNLAKDYWKPDYPHDALLWRLGLFSHGLYALPQPLHHWRKHETSAFAKESRDLKTIGAKKAWIKVAQTINEDMQDYVKERVSGDTEPQLAVLEKNAKWLNRRQRFYNQQTIMAGLNLLPYWGCYPRVRQYPGDWYLIFVKKK